METKYYTVARIDGDYAWLQRTAAQEEPLFIARAHWGHGYAAETLRAALQYLTEEEGVARVTAWCAAENIASRRTLEKAGFELNGQTLDRLDFIYESILSSAGAV